MLAIYNPKLRLEFHMIDSTLVFSYSWVGCGNLQNVRQTLINKTKVRERQLGHYCIFSREHPREH